MNEILETMLNKGEFAGPDGRTIRLRANIPREEGEFLRRIVREVRPTVSVEVGLAYGVSAMFICDALEKNPATRHIVIDPYQQTATWGFGAGLANLERAGHKDVVEFHAADSQVVLPQLAAEDVVVDFAFIDGGHTFDHCLIDFFYIDRMLRVGGIIAFDDSNWPAINKVIRFILSNRNYRVHAALAPAHAKNASLKRQLLLGAALLCARSSSAVAQLFKPQVLATDQSLGITGGRCLALRKESDDTRHGADQSEHRDF